MYVIVIRDMFTNKNINIGPCHGLVESSFLKKISEIDLVKFEASNEFITQNLV
jgi:hypothetical protein